jgi:hypothetical protein
MKNKNKKNKKEANDDGDQGAKRVKTLPGRDKEINEWLDNFNRNVLGRREVKDTYPGNYCPFVKKKTCEQIYREKYNKKCPIKGCKSRYRLESQLNNHMRDKHNISLGEYRQIKREGFAKLMNKYRKLCKKKKQELKDKELDKDEIYSKVKESKEWEEIKKKIKQEKEEKYQKAKAHRKKMKEKGIWR